MLYVKSIKRVSDKAANPFRSRVRQAIHSRRFAAFQLYIVTHLAAAHTSSVTYSRTNLKENQSLEPTTMFGLNRLTRLAIDLIAISTIIAGIKKSTGFSYVPTPHPASCYFTNAIQTSHGAHQRYFHTLLS
jgi:hypothetical protein